MTTVHPQRLGTRARGAFVAAVAIAALALISWFPLTATAHNVVLETSPDAGSTISESPVDIRIVTSDNLLDLTGTGSGFALVVRDSEGLYYGDGCVTIGDADMSATADLGQAGDYTVTFQFVSADGHPLSDNFSFSFAPSESHSPARGFPDPPVCGVESGLVDAPVGEITESTPSPEIVPDTIIEQTVSSDESQSWPTTVIIAGLLVGLSIALLVWMVRRRKVS